MHDLILKNAFNRQIMCTNVYKILKKQRNKHRKEAKRADKSSKIRENSCPKERKSRWPLNKEI